MSSKGDRQPHLPTNDLVDRSNATAIFLPKNSCLARSNGFQQAKLSPKSPLDSIYVSTYKIRHMTIKDNKKTGLAGEIGKKNAFSNLQQETFLNLMRTHAVLSGEFKQKLFRPQGLSHEKYNVLRILAGENRAMQIYEIAERMIAPNTDISRLVERLVASELISRERCDQDGRVVWIELTKQGKSILKKLAQPIVDLHASQFSNLTKKELETLNKLLFKTRSNPTS